MCADFLTLVREYLSDQAGRKVEWIIVFVLTHLG